MRGYALGLLCAMILVPGLGATLALYGPGTVRLPVRLGLSIGFGYAIIGFAGYGLALAHVLRPAPVFVLLGLATAAAWFLGLRRGRLRDHGRRLAEELREDWAPLLVGVVLLGIFGYLRLGRLGGLPLISAMRYWIDAVEMADAGRIPEASLHWGALFPPAISKVLLNSFNAVVSFAVGRDPVPAMPALIWIGAVGFAATLWALGTELGLRFTAPLLWVGLLANRLFLNSDLGRDVTGYRAEVFGRMVAVAALVVVVRALRDRRGRGELVAAGALLAAAAGTHLVPVIVVLAMAASYWVARLVIDRDLRGLLRRGAGVAAASLAFAAAVLLLPRGDIGFQGVEDPVLYDRGGWGFDVTKYAFTGRFEPSREGQGWYVAPGDIVRRFAVQAVGLESKGPLAGRPGLLAATLALALVAAAIVMIVRFPEPLRPLGVVACGLAAALVAVALAFSWQFDLYVPATFGIRRMSDYTGLPLLLAGLAVLEAGLLLVARLPVRAEPVVAAAIVAFLSAGMMATVRVQEPRAREEAVRLLSVLRERTPCTARILTNQRTVGVLRAFTGRVGVLEGMGPFLRPDILDRVVRMLVGARDFFDSPQANRAFLAEHGVDYVVSTRALLGYRGPIGPTDFAPLDAAPFLQPVYTSAGSRVYRVTGLPRGGTHPSPIGQPGFRCERAPLREV